MFALIGGERFKFTSPQRCYLIFGKNLNPRCYTISPLIYQEFQATLLFAKDTISRNEEGSRILWSNEGFAKELKKICFNARILIKTPD